MLGWLQNLGSSGSIRVPGHVDVLRMLFGWRAVGAVYPPPASIGRQAAFAAGSRLEAAYAAGSLRQAGYTAGSRHQAASLTPNP